MPLLNTSSTVGSIVCYIYGRFTLTNASRYIDRHGLAASKGRTPWLDAGKHDNKEMHTREIVTYGLLCRTFHSSWAIRRSYKRTDFTARIE